MIFTTTAAGRLVIEASLRRGMPDYQTVATTPNRNGLQ